MKVNRPIQVPRPEAGNVDSRKADRASAARRATGSGSAGGATNADGDRIETDLAASIESAVERSLEELDARLEDVRARRDELLAKANDPESISRAARALRDSL